jgi:hypothetical protein
LRELLGVCGCDESQVNADDSLEDIVRWLISKANRPLVAVIDEFDVVGPELRKTEQAELRGAITNVPQFAIVAATARQPGAVLEHIGDVVSDLAPVVSIAFPQLGSLRESEGRELIRVGRVASGLAADEDAESELIAWVGLHPLLLHCACYAWYQAVGSTRMAELTAQVMRATKERVFEEVRSQLPFVVRPLSAEARSVLLGTGGSDMLPGMVERAEKELALLGIECWVGRQGMAGPSTYDAVVREEDASPLDDLIRAIAALNRRCELLAGKRGVVFRVDSLATNDGIYLRRTVRSEEDFKLVIEALARLLYDGSYGVVPAKLRGVAKPRLPSFCYNHPHSIITDIIGLRNYYVHLLAEHEAVAEEHLRSAGEAFERYCGIRAPRGEAFEVGRVNLLKRAAQLVERMIERWPLTDVKPEDLFG